MKLDSYFADYLQTNSKWIKDLNLTAKTVKLLEGNKGINHCDFVLGNFFNLTPKAQ